MGLANCTLRCRNAAAPQLLQPGNPLDPHPVGDVFGVSASAVGHPSG
jgi:hypothetical protein